MQPSGWVSARSNSAATCPRLPLSEPQQRKPATTDRHTVGRDGTACKHENRPAEPPLLNGKNANFLDAPLCELTGTAIHASRDHATRDSRPSSDPDSRPAARPFGGCPAAFNMPTVCGQTNDLTTQILIGLRTGFSCLPSRRLTPCGLILINIQDEFMAQYVYTMNRVSNGSSRDKSSKTSVFRFSAQKLEYSA